MVSKRKILDRMVMALAGRVSEEIFFGDDAVGGGAQDDFRKVATLNYEVGFVNTIFRLLNGQLHILQNME